MRPFSRHGLTMNYNYTIEQKALMKRVREFSQKTIAPEALYYDLKSVYPRKTIRKMGKEGFFGVIIPKEFGGLALSTLEYGIVQQEVAAVSPGYTHNGQYQSQKGLLLFGTEDQKKGYLGKLSAAEYIGAIAISEREVGSSFKRMETRAVKKGNAYILHGHKTHINDAAESHVMLLMAKAEKGLTVFILEEDTPGVTFTKKLDPIGLRSSPMYEFTLENVRLPRTQLLGEEGKGLEVFFGIFNFSRIGNASVFIGISHGALNAAIEYAKQRYAGGSRVAEFQGIRWIIADLLTKVEAAELLRNNAALLESAGSPCASETCMAKYFAGEVAREVTNKAIEITGSHGCYRDQPYEMLFRDAKALLVAGGSSEVMKNAIADLKIGR
jgi:alkylation response protein AidB-like acyl-CoA dehydrogenase